MGELATMDRTGDLKSFWDRTKPEEVAQARRTFDDMRAKGYLAFRLIGDGTKGEQIREFDPTAEKIIMSPAMQGG